MNTLSFTNSSCIYGFRESFYPTAHQRAVHRAPRRARLPAARAARHALHHHPALPAAVATTDPDQRRSKCPFILNNTHV